MEVTYMLVALFCAPGLRRDATFYGKNCQMKCSNTCINSQCQLQNATLVCTDGCVPGIRNTSPGMKHMQERPQNRLTDDMDTNMSRTVLLVQLLCSVSCIIGAPHSRHCLWPSASDPCPACERGWYGGDCNFNCSFCDSGVCVRDTGICKQCRAGYFSHNCNVTCPPNCRKNDDGKVYCDRESGVCLQNCKGGWWGDWCERKCSDRCQDNSCYFYDGSCARGCRNGWAGDSCDTRCPGGCHGDTCEQNGSHTCTRGCKHGVHGRHCNKKCNRHCRDQDCFYDHRMNSTVCRQGCVDGWMSLDCKLKCSGNCEACSQETGECSRCTQGYWGTDCTRPCSATCFNQTCDRDGRCSSCQLGYHGDTFIII
ncbi:scavenger receptor class F member 1-like [Haliotis cracherodii]|uniref:scavenger receptor class F member 1-like n=1 Tax=Haliotis cracherodii TaxID=6455 RepID=UPI0039E853C8